MKFEVYDISKYRVPILRNLYIDEIELNLKENVEQLKKQVFELIKIPIDRQIFHLNKIELKNERSLEKENLFENNLSMEIKKKIYENNL